MFNCAGIEISMNKKLVNHLHRHMARLVSFYKRQDENFDIKFNKDRHSYRVPVDLDLPSELDLAVWIRLSKSDRWIKTRVKDISEGGAGCIIPFSDRKQTIKPGLIVDVMIDLGEDNYQTISTIKHITPISCSAGQQKFLEKNFFKKRHPLEGR